MIKKRTQSELRAKAVVLVAALALVAAACGGGDEADDEASTPDTGSASTEVDSSSGDSSER